MVQAFLGLIVELGGEALFGREFGRFALYNLDSAFA